MHGGIELSLSSFCRLVKGMHVAAPALAHTGAAARPACMAITLLSLRTWLHALPAQADPLNANVYIGSISPEVTDEELQGYLEQFGPLLVRSACLRLALQRRSKQMHASALKLRT